MRFSSLLLVAALPAFAHAQSLLRSAPGPAASARYGKSCIVVPDQNGDGFQDLLVGAPGFNQNRGAIYCVSGLHLAFGTGSATLWSLAPTANPGDEFGASLAYVDDANGDGVGDFLVGSPGYDPSGLTNAGALRLVSGSSHTTVSLITGAGLGDLTGFSMATLGDLDFDGKTEVLVGCPGTGNSTSRLYMLRNSKLATGGAAAALAGVEGTLVDTTGAELGTSLAAGFDPGVNNFHRYSGFIAGAPGFDSPGAPNAGKIVHGVVLYSPVSTGPSIYFFSYAPYVSTTPGERLGTSVDATDDYDGDSYSDYIIGAPNSNNGTTFEVGRVLVLSSLRVSNQLPPYEIYSFSGGTPAAPANHTDPNPNYHFGAAVRACQDLNGDGVGDMLMGAPDFVTQGLTTWNFRGLVQAYSGASGAQLVSFTGASTDRLGDTLAGAVEDYDGDGFREFVVAGSSADVNGADSGVVKCYRLPPIPSWTYCTGKVNSLGCTPAIHFSGAPSATSSAPFVIRALNVVNQKNGLLFYGHEPTSAPFQGGVKCVADPTIRTATQNSGGATSGADCSGTFSLDFNARLAAGVDPTTGVVSEIFAQYWSRDPLSPSHTSLSNAVRFVVQP